MVAIYSVFTMFLHGRSQQLTTRCFVQPLILFFLSYPLFSVFQRCMSHDSKSPESSGRRKSKKRSASENILAYLLSHIVQAETPSHVARVLLATLDKIDSQVCTQSQIQFQFSPQSYTRFILILIQININLVFHISEDGSTVLYQIRTGHKSSNYFRKRELIPT